MIYRIRNLIGPERIHAWMPLGDSTGVWVRAVPLPFAPGFLARLYAAWAVLMGDAHAVRWPEPGELEEALRQ